MPTIKTWGILLAAIWLAMATYAWIQAPLPLTQEEIALVAATRAFGAAECNIYTEETSKATHLNRRAMIQQQTDSSLLPAIRKAMQVFVDDPNPEKCGEFFQRYPGLLVRVNL